MLNLTESLANNSLLCLCFTDGAMPMDKKQKYVISYLNFTFVSPLSKILSWENDVSNLCVSHNLSYKFV